MWESKDERWRESKGENTQEEQNVKESKCEWVKKKGMREKGIAWGLRGSIKYFNHRLSCYETAFDPDSNGLL